MFIFNVKLNKNKTLKLIVAVMAIICVSICIVGIFKVAKSNNKFETFEDSCMPPNEIAYLTDENYTNVLKEVHENLDTYVGQKISYTGYIYRVSDLKDNQFILARDMSIKNSTQTVVVGFLCTCQNASDFENYTWVKITGTIEKTDFYGDIPCINISEIEQTKKPDNEIVPEPDENFIPTSVIY